MCRSSGVRGTHPLLGHPAPEKPDQSAEGIRALEASPLTYITSDAPPTLLVHGTEDDISRSESLHNALKKAGVPTKFVPIEGAGHGPGYLGRQIEMSEIQEGYVAWFDQYLKPT